MTDMCTILLQYIEDLERQAETFSFGAEIVNAWKREG
jgi:hypothetical protein